MKEINKKINKTVSLESTNVRLTSNIKIVIDSNNKLWLDTIESNQKLANTKYKSFNINQEYSYSTNIKNFAKILKDSNSLFSVKIDEFKTIDNNLSNSYSKIYKYGCYNDFNDSYKENLRFFAPFYYNTVDKPDAFVIFRSPKNINSVEDSIKKGELVKIFNLKNFNEYVLENIKQSYLSSTFEETFNFEGIDLLSGLHVKKEEASFRDIIENESTLTEYENWLTNTYQRNNSIFSNIINLEFAFDDSNDLDGFYSYSGFYINLNQISERQAMTDFYDQKYIKIIKTQNDLLKYDSTHKIENYYLDLQTSIASSMGKDDKKTIDLIFQLQPEKYSFIQIINNDFVDYQLDFLPNLIGSNIENTIDNVVKEINENYNGNETTVLAEKIDSKTLRLTTNNIIYGDELKIVKSTSNIYISNPIFGNNKDSIFLGPGEKSFTSKYYFDLENGSIVRFNDKLGKEYNVKVLRAYKYRDIYVFDTDTILPEHSGSTNIIFSKEVKDTINVCSILDHYRLDFSGESSDYQDVIDFDMKRYRDYLLKIVNDLSYIGNIYNFYNIPVGTELSQDLIYEYKQIVISKIENYFNTLDIKKQTLIKNIDLIDFESSNTNCEYDRLNEKENPKLMNTNKLYRFINKFGSIEGLDVYGNRYRFNSSLPFRTDNFSTSTKNLNRDVREHTLSWFIIGEGIPPYFQPNNLNDSKKLLSYSKTPIDVENLKSNIVDEYEKLKYENVEGFNFAWSYINYDETQNACFSFFKGSKYRFEDQDLDGYRFSIIIKTSTLLKEEFVLNSYKNDTFKTFTIVIFFYIPDPILTTVDGEVPYFCDRSLFYNSREIYSTTKSGINFGIEKISLDLYNNTLNKSYLNQNVTKDWYYEQKNGERLIYVGRGDSSRFKTSFEDILTINEDLEIFYTKSYDESSPFYGMFITFKNIIEIGKNHFWCKEILIKGNLNGDEFIPDNEIENNIVSKIYEYNVMNEYISNPNLFYENNNIFISKSIANELSSYNKLLSASANNERFKEITLAKIKEKFLKTTINEYQISIVEPKYFEIGVSLQTLNKKLTNLKQSYVYPMFRHISKNIPIMKSVQSYKKINNINGIIPYKNTDFIDYSKIITNIDLSEDSPKVKEVSKSLISNVSNIKFEYLKSNTNNHDIYVEFDWKYNPIELRNYVSLVFNSYKTIEINIDVSQLRSYIPGLIMKYIDKWCTINNIDKKLSDSFSKDKITELASLLQNKQILKDSSLITKQMSNQNDQIGIIDRTIYENFTKEIFLKIYKIKNITDNFGKEYDFSVDGMYLNIAVPKFNERKIISQNQTDLIKSKNYKILFYR